MLIYIGLSKHVRRDEKHGKRSELRFNRAVNEKGGRELVNYAITRLRSVAEEDQGETLVGRERRLPVTGIAQPSADSSTLCSFCLEAVCRS